MSDGLPSNSPAQGRSLCHQCRRPPSRCLCHRVPRIDNRWPVRIIQHQRESRHPLGTALIACLGLSDCLRLVTDDVATSLPPSPTFTPDGQTALIYPGDDSSDIRTLADSPPCSLLFIDASWRKSRRLMHSSPWLQSLPRYSFDFPGPSRYRIRREPRSGYVSTLESIVHVLQLLEQEENRYAPLLEIMDDMINEQIRHMGHETYQRHYGRNQQSGGR